MIGRMRWGVAAVVLLLGVLMPSAARAEHAYGKDCPPPCYSCKHYWAPELWRIHSCIFCPKMNTTAPNRHPEIEPSFKAMRFPCQFAPPRQSSIDFYFTR